MLVLAIDDSSLKIAASLKPNHVNAALKFLSDQKLEESAVVANCRMNRERNLRGGNGYDRELRFDPLEFLESAAKETGEAKWLDLCCGTGKALIEAAADLNHWSSCISIVGVDLVGMFDLNEATILRLVEAPLSTWKPNETFDLITCVHGLHYVGDKLGLIQRALRWLNPNGRFVANLDHDNLKLESNDDSRLINHLRREGLAYSSRKKLLQSNDIRRIQLPFQYLGADDQAGPNYTGQPAVNSHYALDRDAMNERLIF